MLTGDRPDWDSYWLEVATAVAKRADCTRRLAGAVVVDPFNRIVSTGYNGAPSGAPGCLTAGACPRGRMELDEVEPGSSYDTGSGSCIAVHAEANALLHGDATRYRGGTLYVTSLVRNGGLSQYWCSTLDGFVGLHPQQGPCDGCMRLCQGSGLTRVVWPGGQWQAV